MYNQQTGGIKEVKGIDLNTMEENYTYVDNVPQHIQKLCIKIKGEDFDLISDGIFLAISAYFKDALEKIFKKDTIKMQTTFFQFLVSTNWTNILDSIKLVMVALLEKAGVVSLTCSADVFIFITDLEARITEKQFYPGKNGVPKYFRPENRCMMYDMSIDDNSITVSPMYFQFKEDDSLKLYNNDRYVTPKLLKIYEPRQFTVPNYKSALKQLILRDILKLENPIADTVFRI